MGVAVGTGVGVGVAAGVAVGVGVGAGVDRRVARRHDVQAIARGPVPVLSRWPSGPMAVTTIADRERHGTGERCRRDDDPERARPIVDGHGGAVGERIRTRR